MPSFYFSPHSRFLSKAVSCEWEMSGLSAAHPDPEPISSNTGQVFNGFLNLPRWRPTRERAVWDFLQGLRANQTPAFPLKSA